MHVAWNQRTRGIFLTSSLFRYIFVWVRVLTGGSAKVEAAFNTVFRMNQLWYGLLCTTLGIGLIDPERKEENQLCPLVCV